MRRRKERKRSRGRQRNLFLSLSFSTSSVCPYLPVLRYRVLKIVVERAYGGRVLEGRDEVLRGEVGAVFFKMGAEV